MELLNYIVNEHLIVMSYRLLISTWRLCSWITAK